MVILSASIGAWDFSPSAVRANAAILVRRCTRRLLLPSQNTLDVCSDSSTIFEREIGFGRRVSKLYRDVLEKMKLMATEYSLRLGYCKGT